MRSRTGCQTCRSRKIKCDEQKPTCGQCQKADRECRPCDGFAFRHQHNASMNAPAPGPAADLGLNNFYAYKDTFGGDCVWLDIPDSLTFVHVSDPYATPTSPPADEIVAKYSGVSRTREGGMADLEEAAYTSFTEVRRGGLETLPATALDIPSGTTAIQVSVLEHHLNDLDAMGMDGEVLLPDNSSAPVDGTLHASRTLPTPIFDPDMPTYQRIKDLPDMFRGQFSNRESNLRASTETDPRTAFLLRRFSEVTGRWMDLFDQTTFFSSHIPVKSISNPLLKHAACAYAAKQLERVNGSKRTADMELSRPATMEVWPKEGTEKWALLAAEHYDKAITLLKDALQWDHAPSADNSAEEIDRRHYAPRTIEGMVEERKLRRRQFSSAQSTAKSDDLLAATAILCEFESIDASNAAWAHHLSGTKSLLDVVEVGMMPFDGSMTERHQRKPSQARKAIFWNFARQDMFAAFKNECRTRLDTEDVAIWRNAGLLLDEHGLVVPSNTPDSGLGDGNGMREDMIGNALIWLVSRLINLIYGHTDADNTPLSAKWTTLNHELEIWFNGVPETFMPSAIIPVRPHGASLTEVWSSIPVTQATVMIWHMAQILILVHKPPSLPLPHIPNPLSSRTSPPPTPRRQQKATIAQRIQSYRDIDTAITFHSRQILGICLSRPPDDGVRIMALHPLYVVGQCLAAEEEEPERKVVVDLLMGVEREAGWATGYRVEQLVGGWGWDGDDREGGWNVNSNG